MKLLNRDSSSFYQGLLTLGIPIMLQNLVNSLVNIIDTVMIGRLGTTEIAAVGLGNQLFFIYNLILFGIGNGGSIFAAQYWGKKDIKGIRMALGFCLSFGTLVGAVVSLVALLIPETILSIYTRDPAVIQLGASYLKTLVPSFIPFAVGFMFTATMRSIGKVRLPMVSTFIALFLNMVLNYLLIFGIGPFPELGVVGAAMATVAARIVEMALLVLVSYARGYAFAGRLRELLSYRLDFVRRFFRICTPVILNEFIWSIGISLQSLIMARTHTDAIAAHNIVNNVSQLTWTAFIGLGNAAGVLVGNKIGEGAEDTARRYASKVTRFAFTAAIGAAFLLLPISLLLPHLFKVNPQVLGYTGSLLLILAFMYPFRAFNMTMIVGVCRAGGDTIFCFIYDLLIMWTVALPLAALATFVFHAPVWIVALCISLEDPFKMLLGLWRLRSGKWLHNVTV